MAPDPTRRTGRHSELKDPGYELFVAALSILSIVNLVLLLVLRSDALSYVVLAVNAALSVVLFLDFSYRLWTADSRSGYFFRGFGWADLLASIPLLHAKVLRVFRLLRVYRLLRAYGARNLARSLRQERAGSALFSLLFVAVLVLEFGSLAMLRLESQAPDANITSASDALWYTLVTISTVGYGDQFPVTNPGRALGAVVIIVGVGIFGTLTGYLANAFLAPRRTADPESSGDAEPSTDGQPPASSPDASPVDAQLARLERLAGLQTSGVLSAEDAAGMRQRILDGP